MTNYSNVPEARRLLLEEKDELEKVFPTIYTKSMYSRIQYKVDSFTGICLWQHTGCVSHSWGDISELQILQAQRLWAIDRVLYGNVRD